jgi:broad specificity phosphatase PhoE
MNRRINLVRHGETEWSLTGRHTGRTDIPLTEHGENCARRLGELLRKTMFNHVLTSPLLRARRTCELAGLGAAARVAPNLCEWDYGEYEGRTPVDIRAENPDWNVFQYGAPGGESPDQVSDRADQMVATLRGLEGTIVLFSHGHFLRALAVRWIGLPIREGRCFGLDTASRSILAYDHNNLREPTISLWNATSNELSVG